MRLPGRGRPGARGEEEMSAHRLQVGVLGVGHLGAYHARHYARHPAVVLAGVADRDAARAAAVGAELGVRVFPSAEDLVAAVDALSVAVPAADHAACAIPALERGKAVLLEKPMAPSVAAATAIRDAARRGGAPLMIGHVERWNGAFRRVAPLIRTPRFIEGHRLSSFVARGLDVDVIFDLMIHDLDLVAALTPAPVRRVIAVGVPVLTASADIANARIEFADGLVANLTASRVSREKMRKLRLFQADAYVSIDFAARAAEVITRRPGAAAILPGAGTAALPALLASLDHQVIDAKGDPEPLAAEIAAFVEAVASGRPPVPSGDDGLRAVELAAAVAESMAEAAAGSAAGV